MALNLNDCHNADVNFTDCDIAPWSDLSPPILNQADWLQVGSRYKVHKPIMERQKCGKYQSLNFCIATKVATGRGSSMGCVFAS